MANARPVAELSDKQLDEELQVLDFAISTAPAPVCTLQARRREVLDEREGRSQTNA